MSILFATGWRHYMTISEIPISKSWVVRLVVYLVLDHTHYAPTLFNPEELRAALLVTIPLPVNCIKPCILLTAGTDRTKDFIYSEGLPVTLNPLLREGTLLFGKGELGTVSVWYSKSLTSYFQLMCKFWVLLVLQDGLTLGTSRARHSFSLVVEVGVGVVYRALWFKPTLNNSRIPPDN